ncbi:hemolysin family protein, partial [Bacteroidales bacterium OttesenSCG-928-M11]|nr:hemolysin family protein [Bacteroidales bacterium OttesenSCG-928-M11]
MISSLIYIFISLLFLAFFSSSKIAFTSSNILLLELENKRKGLTNRIVNVFFTHATIFKSTLTIGYIVSFILSAYQLIELLSNTLSPIINNSGLSLLIQIITTTLLILLFGEYLPRLIAYINPNRYLNIVALPLYIFYILLYPISTFTLWAGWIISKISGVKYSISGESSTSIREELDHFIQKTIKESTENSELDQEIKLFQNAIEFSSLKVRDCMIPRTEIIAINKNAEISELTNLFVKTGLSKIVVYKEEIDNIIGYIHSSELFVQREDWTKSIIPLPFIPENMQANTLMKNMLAEKRSMAVIVDEFGGTVGIITLEDLVEEIFGEIEDEHDTQNIISKQLGENEYVISGRMEIDQINEKFELSIPESDEYKTIAGYILNHHQNIPYVHEVIQIDRYTFKIIKVSQNKIELIRMKIN